MLTVLQYCLRSSAEIFPKPIVYGMMLAMRTPDLDRARSEKNRSLAEFLTLYNENLPIAFPRASTALLEEFRTAHKGLFARNSQWSLDQHRKKVMDWLRSHEALS